MNLYGLIGYPLGHSFSKKYFTAKFESEGLLDCRFELFPVETIDLFPGLIASLDNVKGIAVTIPYKQDVIAFLDNIDPEAALIGAVNCIAFKGSLLTGYNTDCVGFKKSFVPLLKSSHKGALILGTGGSSKAVKYVLNQLGLPFLSVSRSPGMDEVGYHSITAELMTAYNIIINCTPVGMAPAIDGLPAIPYELITSQHYCYDLIYAPAKTKFLEIAEEKGATFKNGYDMLLLQAEENWKIWNS